MPDMVGLWEAVQQQERWAISTSDAVDGDLGLDFDIKRFETFKHLLILP
jgi:hypothetical protein